MKPLLDAVVELVKEVSTERLEVIARNIRDKDKASLNRTPSSWFPNARSRSLFDNILSHWKESSISSAELSGIILGSIHAYEFGSKEVVTDLIWTGPNTPISTTRNTRQALLEVINSAQASLFITSYVAYKTPIIVDAVREAIARGVSVSMLLESSKDFGGGVDTDSITRMKKLMPEVSFYYWGNKPEKYDHGVVHAKVAVADNQKCFISSANLTGHAMEKNMEAGVIVTGGNVPKSLHDHLGALVTTRVVELIIG